ncbi:hypothetical protein [uncultured Dechloromonas sp.]|uniref:hypothetical protein n=1 Tax=uncultured Dechloromonas sp. TaxID=171719 RepID=UPI0025CC7528|nr:hypothetical protein [uncultured Dechloromonas sp.]
MLSEVELTAEQRFHQAFERLKANEPQVLVRNTPVSQNNVAKEAGCDPSALRKSRFPSLVREIQAYVELHKDELPSKRQTLLKQRAIRQKQRDQLADVIRQRDAALSQIASANRRVVELSEEVKMLRLRLEEFKPPPSPICR